MIQFLKKRSSPLFYVNNQLSTEDQPMNKNEQNKKKKLEEKPENYIGPSQ